LFIFGIVMPRPEEEEEDEGEEDVDGPPSVRPELEEKAAEGFAGPVDAALEAVVMAVRREEGSAPRIVCVTVPFLRMRKVGMAETPNCLATAC